MSFRPTQTAAVAVPAQPETTLGACPRDGAGEPAPGGIPAYPPPEVLAAMAVAAEAWNRLAESGRTVRFATGPGRLSIQLIDRRGEVAQTLSPSRLLELAGGGAID